MNAKAISDKLGLVSKILAYIGAFSLIAIMGLTIADVVGRKFFNSPILGATEMTKLLVLIVVFSFLAYAQSHKSHVSVDIFMNIIPKKIRDYIELFNHSVCLLLMVLITWMGLEKALELRETGDATPNLGIPDYPFVFFLTLGCAVVCIEFIRDLILLVDKKREL